MAGVSLPRKMSVRAKMFSLPIDRNSILCLSVGCKASDRCLLVEEVVHDLGKSQSADEHLLECDLAHLVVVDLYVCWAVDISHEVDEELHCSKSCRISSTVFFATFAQVCALRIS